MARTDTPGGRKRWLPAPVRWALWTLVGVVTLLVVGSAVVVALGITVSAGPWRGQLAQAISEAIGREVRFEGPMEMQPTLRPAFRVGGITVANPTGFQSPFFASLGHATLRVDLLALLRGEVHVLELTAQGVKVHLERNGQAQVNWLFELARKAPSAKKSSTAPNVRLMALNRIVFKDLRVDYVGGPDLPLHVFTLDSLEGTAEAGLPLSLQMHGSVETRFPYSVTVQGGSVAALTGEPKPWPLEFTLEFAGTHLRIAGELRPDAAQTSANLTFGLGADDLGNLERLLQTPLPPVGATALSGRVVWEKGVLDVRDLRGVMGNSQVDGQIWVDVTKAVPHTKGWLKFPVFDVTPFRVKQPAAKQASDGKPVDLQALKARHLEREYQFRELSLVEADLALEVQRWIGLPGAVRDSQLQVSVHRGVLKAPIKTTVADVALKGELALDGAAATPTFFIQLGADDTPLGELGRLLTGAPGVKGKLGHFGLRFAGTGNNLAALLQTLEMNLEVSDGALTYGNVEGGRPVEVRLERFEMALPAGGRLRGSIRGALLGERVSAQFKGGDLYTLTDEIQWPVEFSASGAGATLEIRGKVAAPEKNAGTELDIKMVSPRAGSVARWLGLSPKSTAAVALSGHVRVQSDEWRLSNLALRLGKTQLSGDLARVGIDRKPLVQVKLRVENFEMAELEAMLPPAKPGPAKPVIELPILPQGIDLTDADVDVSIKRIAFSPMPVTDVTFVGRMRDGKMYASPFSARYINTDFRGAMALDMRAKIPEGTLWLAVDQPNIGQILRSLKIVENLDLTAQLLQLQLLAKGHRLGEMLERSALIATVEGGAVTLGGVQGKGGVRIALSKGLAEAKPKEAVHVDLDGMIDQTPVKIRIASGTTAELLRAASFVPFSLSAEAAGTQLSLTGKVSLPVSEREVELKLAVAGERVNSLEELARVSLPRWGPYSLQSRFRVSKAGYEMPGLSLKVGSSELQGQGRVLLAQARPRIEVQLAAPRIQLDDFKLAGWALAEKKPAQDDKKMSEAEMRKAAKEASAKTEELLSPATLRRQDVTLAVDVSEVLAGRDRLGSGSLRASLLDGKLAFGPAEVNVPGGSAKLWMDYYPTGSGIEIDGKIRVERFDYGVLARRFKPESDLQGLFSLQVDLKSRTPSLARAMQNGNGRVDFAVWPKNMKAGIFDLWAVNLFVALIPAVDAASESKVNCAVGRFNLKNGVLTEESILLDTSRMRVSGVGRVDFDSESLSLKLTPKPKKPQFFSLATPVEVSGKVTSPKINVSAAAVVGTTARLITSLITTPFERLLSKEIPRDGADVCKDALRLSR